MSKKLSISLFIFQRCGIFLKMNTQSQSRFPGCGGSLLNLISDCNQFYDGSLESDQILNRGQLTRKRVNEGTSCCRNHKIVMGKYFHVLDATHKRTKCQSPHHVGKNKFLAIGKSPLREIFDMWYYAGPPRV